MRIDQMRDLLEEAMDRIARTPLLQITERPIEEFFEEHGTPDHSPADYCQIAVEILDETVDDGVVCALIGITATSQDKVLGSTVSAWSDGRPSIKGEIAEFRDGVAVPHS